MSLIHIIVAQSTLFNKSLFRKYQRNYPRIILISYWCQPDFR